MKLECSSHSYVSFRVKEVPNHTGQIMGANVLGDRRRQRRSRSSQRPSASRIKSSGTTAPRSTTAFSPIHTRLPMRAPPPLSLPTALREAFAPGNL